MRSPYQNLRILRRYQQIISAVFLFGFGQMVQRLKLLNVLKFSKTPAISREHKEKSAAVRFRLMLEHLGPTFIKIGQILSTRADLLPEEIIQELSSLQDHVQPKPWEWMEKHLRPQIGDYFETNFAQFDPEPVASASIAQVYHARLKTGQEVAVKVVRPNTEKIFKDDLLILEDLARWLHDHISQAAHWDPETVLQQIRTSIQYELDMRHEGRNVDIFRQQVGQDPTVYVPKIYWEYTNRHILVMEYVHGRKLQDYLQEGNDLEARKKLAANGARLILRQVFEEGFFQADPHPGNILVMKQDVICLLDFGMFARLTQRNRDLLARVLQAVVKKDMDRLFKAIRDLEMVTDEENYPELKTEVLDLVEQYHGIPLKQIDIRKLLSDILGLVFRYHLRIRHDFLFLIKALGTLEAMGRKLQPEFDLIEHLKPFVHKLVMRRYSPRYLLEETQRFSEDFLQLTGEFPEHLLEILRNLRAGRLKMEFEHRGLERSMNHLDRMSDKVVLGLIVAALIIASAVMAQAQIGPELWGFPVIGGIGFLIAGITGLWMIFDILRNRLR